MYLSLVIGVAAQTEHSHEQKCVQLRDSPGALLQVLYWQKRQPLQRGKPPWENMPVSEPKFLWEESELGVNVHEGWQGHLWAYRDCLALPSVPPGWTFTTVEWTHLHRAAPMLARADWLSLLRPGLVFLTSLPSGVGSAILKTLFIPISPPDEVHFSHIQLRNLHSKMLISFGLSQNSVCFQQEKLGRTWAFPNNAYHTYVFLLHLLMSMTHCVSPSSECTSVLCL